MHHYFLKIELFFQTFPLINSISPLSSDMLARALLLLCNFTFNSSLSFELHFI